MTEPIFPDRIADELLAGTADPSALDANMRGVAEVLAAAQQPATAAELAGMDAAVVALQGIVASPVSAPGAITPSRSVIHMISTRVPKRVAIVAGATLLFAGTAAAAAGGHLPSPWASPRVYQTKPFATTTTSTTIENTTTTATTVPEETSTTAAEETSTTEATTSSTEVATETTLYPGRDFGLCTAWTNGAPKKADNPAFSYLADEAVANGAADVDAYCELVIADKKAHQDDTDADGTDTSTTEATSTTAAGATVTRPTMPEQAQGGKGAGKGKGKP